MTSFASYEVPEVTDLEARVLAVFSELGYRLEQRTPNRWVFIRGSTLASLWRFDIRAYHTTVTIECFPTTDDKWRVTCNHEVMSFGALCTGADSHALLSEAERLHSELLRKGT